MTLEPSARTEVVTDLQRAVAEAGTLLREAQPGLARSFWAQATSEQMDLEAWRACQRKVA